MNFLSDVSYVPALGLGSSADTILVRDASAGNSLLGLTIGTGLTVTSGVLSTTAGGTIGGSTGSVDNRILRADGTGGSTLQESHSSINDVGDITLGLTTTNTGSTTHRYINAQGSTADAHIYLNGQGNGGVWTNNYFYVDGTYEDGVLWEAGVQHQVSSSLVGNTYFEIRGYTGITGLTKGGDVHIFGGYGQNAGSTDGGDVYISGGDNRNGGADGNVAIGHVRFPSSTVNFQGMETGIFIEDAATNPSGNPTGGGFMYSDAGDGNKLKWRVPGGTTYDLTDTGGSGSIGGSIADEQIAIGSATNTIEGRAGLLYHAIASDYALLLEKESAAAPTFYLGYTSNSAVAGADSYLGIIESHWGGSSKSVARIAFKSGIDTTNKDDGAITFETKSTAGTFVEAFRVKESQQLQAASYGGAGFTGTATKWLAVDVNGNIIQEDAPGGGTIEGSVGPTAGLIPYGTGTANTVTTTAGLLYNAGANTLTVQKLALGSTHTFEENGTDGVLDLVTADGFRVTDATPAASIGSFTAAIKPNSNKNATINQIQTGAYQVWLSVENSSTTADSYLAAASSGTGDAFTQYRSVGQTKSFATGIDGGTGDFKLTYAAATGFGTAARMSVGSTYLTVTSGGIISTSSTHTSGISAADDIITKGYADSNYITGGTMDDWTVAASSGTPAVISDNETVTFVGSGSVSTSISGNTVTITGTDNNTATAADNILDGSNSGTQITYAPYAAKGTAGRFYSSGETPTGSVRLNYDGYFFPTYINLLASADTGTAATHYFVETGTDGYVRPKTLANVKTEIVTNSAVVAGLGYTPYNSTNPNGYITSSGSITGDAGSIDGIDSSRIVYGTNSRKGNNIDPNSVTGSGFSDYNGGNNPTATWYSVFTSHYQGGSYGHQIAGSFYSTSDIYNRNYNNGTWGSWTKIWNAANLTNLNQLTNGPGYITSSGSITGNADTATTATNANNVNTANDSSSTLYYIPFGAATGNHALYTNTGLSYRAVGNQLTNAGDIASLDATAGNLITGSLVTSLTGGQELGRVSFYSSQGGTYGSGTNVYIAGHAPTTTSGELRIYTRNGPTTTYRARLSEGGQWDVDGNVVAYSTVTSDIRLKDVQETIAPAKALELVLSLDAFTYKHKYKKDGTIHTGYSAQEVKKIIPNIVNEAPLWKAEDWGLDVKENYMDVNYVEIIPYITEAIKEQQSIIDSQQKEINELKKLVEMLLNK